MERRITAFLHARGATLLFLVASCVVACVARSRGLVLPVVPDLGLGLPAPAEWMGHMARISPPRRGAGLAPADRLGTRDGSVRSAASPSLLKTKLGKCGRFLKWQN